MITLLAMQRCPQSFESVVFAGVPFIGGAGPFDDLFLGSKVARNKTLLAAEVLWSFPSIWQALPEEDDFFVDEKDQPVKLEVSDPATWKGWQLPCAKRLEDRLRDRKAISVARKEGLTWSGRAMAVIGRGRPTIAAVRVKSDGTFDFANPKMADGDGIVLATRAVPPMKSTWVLTETSHAALFNDPEVRKAVEAFFK
jgi:hypothetical protein